MFIQKDLAMSNPKIKKSNVLEVRFVADEDVLKHISENTGSKVRKNKAPDTLDLKRWVKKVESSSEDEAQDILEEQDYVSVLGTDVQGSLRNGSSTGGGDVFSFQTPKRSNKMAEKACELAYQPGKNVNHDRLKNLEKEASTPKSGKKYCMSSKGQEESTKKKFVSETPYRLRKRITALNMCSDSESEYSASCSEEEGSDSCRGTADEAVHPETPTRPQTTAPTSKETSVKKLKRDIPKNLVEEYFEAHSSSKILTSDRTLQKLQKKKLDQETLQNLLNKVPVAFAAECEKLIKQHESLFYKWMLQLHLGFNIVLYGLGSKKDLLENFRISLLQNSVHIVVNGFFPSITVKSVGRCPTGEEQRASTSSARKNEATGSKLKGHSVADVSGGEKKFRCCKEHYTIGTWNVRSMNQGKLDVVKQEMTRLNIDILGIRELKWTGMGEFNSDDQQVYYCGQESLRRNGVAFIVNKRVEKAVMGYNLQNDRMISVRIQDKPFNITVVQVRASTADAEEAEVDRFYEGLQHLVEITAKVKVLHLICQQIWKTQQWPQDWKRSVYIPIPKKGNAKECSNCHTIALISHEQSYAQYPTS
ncbi:Origin recognition complex subunit 2 [Varanus komodoensis]|nr:Origin recognition complex subunit 2 [Varanus komodoensis]